MFTADPEPLEAAIAALRRAPRATVLRVLDLLEGLDAYGPDPSAEAISEAHAWTDRIGAEQRRPRQGKAEPRLISRNRVTARLSLDLTYFYAGK